MAQISVKNIELCYVDVVLCTVASDKGYIALWHVACYIVCYRTTKVLSSDFIFIINHHNKLLSLSCRFGLIKFTY